MRSDDRFVVELPSGIAKNPMLKTAGDYFSVNDVVYIDGDTVYPMFDETKKLYGVCISKGIKGKKVLIAT